MTDEIVQQVSDRYIELYENITGDRFVRSDVSHVTERIETNILKCLKELEIEKICIFTTHNG